MDSSASFPGSQNEEKEHNDSGSDEVSEEFRQAEEREWKWVLAFLNICSASFGVWFGLIGPDFESIMPYLIVAVVGALIIYGSASCASQEVLRENTRQLLITTSLFTFAVIMSHYIRLKVDPPREFTEGFRSYDPDRFFDGFLAKPV